MRDGWESLGERSVSVSVKVPVAVSVRKEGEKFRAKVDAGPCVLEVTASTREGAVRAAERVAALALGRALSAA